MRTNRKMEEKKMSMSKNIARLAVTAGLTAALSFGGVMAPVTMAFAESNTTVTFDYGGYEGSTTYKGIQIFTADVDGSTVKNIQWAGANATEQKAIQDAVVHAIQKKEPAYNKTTAQDAADWLNEKAGVSESASQVANDNVLSMIADNLKDNAKWQKTSDAQQSLSNLDAGYWLFLTDTTVKPGDKSTDAYSAPVYAVIDGTNKTVKITPKKSVPTVNKKILDDDDDDADAATDIKNSNGWKDVADSQIGQEVNYKLTGTIASNYATFDTYAYKFTDRLSTGLDYVDNSVEVYALNNNAYTKISSSSYTVSFQDKNLTVDFAVDNNGKKGLKSATADGAGTLSIDAKTEIVVFYKAKLNKDAVIGNSTTENTVGGNPNTVKLEYSNNPYGEGTGETIEDAVADFAFKLNLKKVDQGTEKGLGDAVFTIQSADENTQGQYIASTDDAAAHVVAGQLVENVDSNNLPNYVKFTSSNASGEEGLIRVKGLDAGSYTVTEIQTPDDTKYTKANPFTFTITPEYNKATMKVTKLTAAVSTGDEGRSDIAFGELDGSAGDNKLNGTDDAAVNAAAGEVTINVGNTKSVGLPLTGLNGVTFTWIAGGAVLCIGVAHLIRSRKQAEESEQE